MSDSPTLPPSSTSLTIVPFSPPSPPRSSPSSSSSIDPFSGNGGREKGESPRTRSKRGSISAKDRSRWRKWKDGASEAEIAAQEGRSELLIRNSIEKVRAYQFSVSHEAVDMAANEVAIDALSKLSGLIDQLLAATRDKTVVNSEGKEEVIQVADLKTRATVVDKITKLIQSVRKGDGGINISNISQQNNAVVIAGAGKGRSVEERIRALREKNNLRNDDDAPMIDAEPLDEDEDEDEDGYEGGEDEEGDETEYEDGGDDGESEVEREEGIGDANPPA